MFFATSGLVSVVPLISVLYFVVKFVGSPRKDGGLACFYFFRIPSVITDISCLALEQNKTLLVLEPSYQQHEWSGSWQAERVDHGRQNEWIVVNRMGGSGRQNEWIMVGGMSGSWICWVTQIVLGWTRL